MLRLFCPIAAALAALCACAAPTSEKRGERLYADLCSSCHGSPAGRDAPKAAELARTPPDLTLLRKRNGGVFPTEDAMSQIYGYHGRSRFGAMPEFARVLDGPTAAYRTASGDVISTPQDLIDVTYYLRTQQR